MGDDAPASRPEGADAQASDASGRPLRFFCPVPGCQRSFSAFWRCVLYGTTQHSFVLSLALIVGGCEGEGREGGETFCGREIERNRGALLPRLPPLCSLCSVGRVARPATKAPEGRGEKRAGRRARAGERGTGTGAAPGERGSGAGAVGGFPLPHRVRPTACAFVPRGHRPPAVPPYPSVRHRRPSFPRATPLVACFFGRKSRARELGGAPPRWRAGQRRPAYPPPRRCSPLCLPASTPKPALPPPLPDTSPTQIPTHPPKQPTTHQPPITHQNQPTA
jgi:hypothetical protein